MLFAHLDESDDSSDEQNDTNGAPAKIGGSVREEGLNADSNENSSIRGAPASSVAGGGRPQRKQKSNFIIPSKHQKLCAGNFCENLCCTNVQNCLS